jgi:hypothetical protein
METGTDPQQGNAEMITYQATSAATRKNRPIGSGFDTEAQARAQAEFLADTYGGVAKVAKWEGEAIGAGTISEIAKYSTARGWH